MNALGSELILDTKKALTGFRNALKEINKLSTSEGKKAGSAFGIAFSKYINEELKKIKFTGLEKGFGKVDQTIRDADKSINHLEKSVNRANTRAIRDFKTLSTNISSVVHESVKTNNAINKADAVFKQFGATVRNESSKMGRDIEKFGIVVQTNLPAKIKSGTREAKNISKQGGREAGQSFSNEFIASLSLIASSVGFMQLQRVSRDLRDSFMRFEDSLIGVSKTANLTEAETKKLGDDVMELSHKTRTSREELLKYGQIGGMIGLNGDELLDFITTLDILSVGLKETFGQMGGEEMATAVGKLSNIFRPDFQKQGRTASQAILSLGSAMNELEKAGFSTGPAMADMAGRIGGVGAIMGLTADQALGIASVLEETGVRTERGGTAVGQLLQRMARNSEAFAAQAGVPLQEFEKLLNEDINEALILVATSLNQSGFKNTEVADAFEDLETTGAGVTEALTKIGANTDILRARQALAKKAMSDTSDIMQEYAKIQATSSATQERFNNALDNTKTKIQAQLQPMFDKFLQVLTKVVIKIGELAEENPTLTRTISVLVSGVASLITGLVGLSGALSVLSVLKKAPLFIQLKTFLTNAGILKNLSTFSKVFTGFGPNVLKLVTNLGKVLPTITRFGQLLAKSTPLLARFGGVVARIIPFIGKIGVLFSNLGLIIQTIGSTIAAAFAAVSAPVWIVIGVVTALVAAFIYLWNTSESFRNFFVGIWDGIVSAVQTAGQKISETYQKLVKFVNWAKDNKAEAFGYILGRTIRFLYFMFKKANELMLSFLASVGQFIVAALYKIGELITNGVTALGTFVTNALFELGKFLTNTAVSLWNTIKTIFAAMQAFFSKENMIALFTQLVVAAIIQGIRLREWFKETSENLKASFVSFVANAIIAFQNFPANVRRLATEAWNWILHTFSRENIINMLTRFGNFVVEQRAKVEEQFRRLGKSALDAVISVFSIENLAKIGDNIRDAISGAINWGKDQWNGFTRGLRSGLKGEAPPGMATGGAVTGGSNVVRLLNDGKGSKAGQEYVINAEAVKALGKPFLDSINNIKPSNINNTTTNTTNNNIYVPVFTNTGFQFI